MSPALAIYVSRGRHTTRDAVQIEHVAAKAKAAPGSLSFRRHNSRHTPNAELLEAPLARDAVRRIVLIGAVRVGTAGGVNRRDPTTEWPADPRLLDDQVVGHSITFISWRVTTSSEVHAQWAQRWPAA